MDPKGIAAAVSKKLGGDAGSDEGGEDDGLSVAGANVMSAMQDGDAEAFTAALKDFVGMCGSYSADTGED